MSNLKKLFILLFSLAFGVIFVMAVSLGVACFSGRAAAAGTPGEGSVIDTDGVESIRLTVELGKVRLVPADGEALTVDYRYPPADFLDDSLRITADRDGRSLDIRISSKQKVYFFGLIRDRACDITVGIPQGLLPSLSVKLQAGTLTVDGPELSALEIDGDIAQIELLDLGEPAPETVTVSNNLGSVTAYLDNRSGSGLKHFDASVNIGTAELHLLLDGSSGCRLDYACTIGTVEQKNERRFLLGAGGSCQTEGPQAAEYRVKTDVGVIRVLEDRAVL